MRQDASGRRQGGVRKASGWRQDDVKRRGARINWPNEWRRWVTSPTASAGPASHLCCIGQLHVRIFMYA